MRVGRYGRQPERGRRSGPCRRRMSARYQGHHHQQRDKRHEYDDYPHCSRRQATDPQFLHRQAVTIVIARHCASMARLVANRNCVPRRRPAGRVRALASEYGFSRSPGRKSGRLRRTALVRAQCDRNRYAVFRQDLMGGARRSCEQRPGLATVRLRSLRLRSDRDLQLHASSQPHPVVPRRDRDEPRRAVSDRYGVVLVARIGRAEEDRAGWRRLQ